jgi:hypothetical protein
VGDGRVSVSGVERLTGASCELETWRRQRVTVAGHLQCNPSGHRRRDLVVRRHHHGRTASGTEIEARGVLEAWKKSGQSLEGYARSRGLVPQRLHWWKTKLRFGAVADKGRTVALLPVRVTETRAESRRGEPVTVLLRSGHMIKVGRDFDESAFARVVALLERA